MIGILTYCMPKWSSSVSSLYQSGFLKPHPERGLSPDAIATSSSSVSLTTQLFLRSLLSLFVSLPVLTPSALLLPTNLSQLFIAVLVLPTGTATKHQYTLIAWAQKGDDVLSCPVLVGAGKRGESGCLYTQHWFILGRKVASWWQTKKW